MAEICLPCQSSQCASCLRAWADHPCECHCNAALTVATSELREALKAFEGDLDDETVHRWWSKAQARLRSERTRGTEAEMPCVCGHPAQDHHTSIGRDGRPVYGECLFFGFNEAGGMEKVNGRWVDHCYSFKPVEATK